MDPHVGDDLVVAAAAGVELGAGFAGDLGEPALNRHVHILVGIGRNGGAGLDLAPDGREAVLDGPQLGAGEHARIAQGAGVRHRALDVLGPEAPIERQRAVQRHERGRALAGEASRARDRHAVYSVMTASYGPGDGVVLEFLHHVVLLADPGPDLDRQAPQLDEPGGGLV